MFDATCPEWYLCYANKEQTMSPKETKLAVKSLQEHRKQVTASATQAKAFLVRAGILSKNGQKLTSTYR